MGIFTTSKDEVTLKEQRNYLINPTEIWGRIKFYFLIAILSVVLIRCDSDNTSVKNYNSNIDAFLIEEVQLTNQPRGHFLNQRQAFSPDDKWLVFDNRNEDSKIGENGSIQVVNVETKKLETVYKLDNQNEFGPGVGAASFHPLKNEIVFIHGLMNASGGNPYGFTARFGMQLMLGDSVKSKPMEARDVIPPYTKGALRGGSHAYAYSSDGNLVSFTYNDAVLAKQSERDADIQDLRTVGAFIEGKPVDIQGLHDDENFSGDRFAVLLAKVVAHPKPGSNEILKAYEECWVGDSGYTRLDGKQQKGLAFLGDLMTASGEKITEVYITDIPSDMTGFIESVDAGSHTALPSVPKGVVQRRLTYTEQSPYPGVQGPRQWLRSSPDGNSIYFYKKDDQGIVQIHGVSPKNGGIKQITNNGFSPDTAFGLSSDGKFLAYGAGESLFISRVSDGATVRVLEAKGSDYSDLSNINWSNSGYTLAYNRKVNHGGQAFFQVFILNLLTLLNQTL